MAFDFTGGYINIVNFGFAAFVGLGAYASAIISVKLGISPWIGMFVGILPAALVGFLTGILTLRLRGIYAAVMVFFLSLALMGLTTKWVSLTEGPLCGVHDRERHLFLYFVRLGLIMEQLKGAKILHFAPEKRFAKITINANVS